MFLHKQDYSLDKMREELDRLNFSLARHHELADRWIESGEFSRLSPARQFEMSHDWEGAPHAGAYQISTLPLLSSAALLGSLAIFNDAGIEATALHADKTQAQRSSALDAFKKGKIRVLVATDIAQRGLDISGISHVVNYDVPGQAEDYVHRIGRTGRAAQTGDAFTFMAPDEIAMVRTIERVLGNPIERISMPGFDFG